MARVLIDPITRIEGHLSIELDVQGGKVVDARCRGDMFRGFETILQGRNPVDANQITQRICGVCPVSHAIASSKCLDDAFGSSANKNGRLLRNLVLSANYLQSHILHFYHLCALDYVDITAVLQYSGSDNRMQRLKAWAKNDIEVKQGRADEITSVAPFLPRYEGEGFYISDLDTNLDAIAGYVEALDMRQKAHQMVALFGGRAPHLIGVVPGGVATVPDRSGINRFRKTLREIEKFIDKTYAAHVTAVAKTFPEYFELGGYSNFMSCGVFENDDSGENFMFGSGLVSDLKLSDFNSELIREHVRYGKYSSKSNLHPFQGETEPAPRKQGAYTWLKAPRYDGKPMEVGPLARIAVAYLSGNENVKGELNKLLDSLDLEIPAAFSVLGRHASRLIECKLLAKEMHKWLDELERGGKPRNSYTIPDQGEGIGLVEAPRGTLGHWIVINRKEIRNYQCIVPTTWFCSPRDDKGIRGPVEEALIGTPISDNNNPIEAARVVRSFDPCIACAVHVVEGDREIAKFRVC